MRRTLQIGVIFTGACLLAATGTVLAQQPPATQPGRNPAATPPINPSTNPQNPGVTGEPMQTQSKMDDKKFVKDAAVGGMTEVELGKLAAQKGSSEGVKQFGQKMVDDHTKANDELKKVASAQSITIPDAIDSKHQSRIDKLSKLSGAAFDKAYIKDQLKDHEQDVRDFQREAQNGSDPAVKDFASKTLPTLQEHLNMVKDLNKGKTTTADADRSKQ